MVVELYEEEVYGEEFVEGEGREGGRAVEEGVWEWKMGAGCWVLG
jgi:hypothetical protein